MLIFFPKTFLRQPSCCQVAIIFLGIECAKIEYNGMECLPVLKGESEVGRSNITAENPCKKEQ